MIAWPTPPQPTTTALSPGAHPRGVEHGADAGGHAAADQRGDLRRHARIDGDRRRLRHDRGLGERAEAEVARARRRSRDGVLERARAAAQPRPAGGARARSAGTARTTRARRGRRRRTSRTAGPDRLDDARALVAEHERQRDRPVAVEGVQVGVADAAGGQPHADLVAGRRPAASSSAARERRADAVRAGLAPSRDAATSSRSLVASASPLALDVQRARQEPVHAAGDDEADDPSDVDAVERLGHETRCRSSCRASGRTMNGISHTNPTTYAVRPAPRPHAVDPVRLEELGDGVVAAADEEVVDQVGRRPGHQQVEHQGQGGEDRGDRASR